MTNVFDATQRGQRQKASDDNKTGTEWPKDEDNVSYDNERDGPKA